MARGLAARDSSELARLIETPEGRRAHPAPERYLPLLYFQDATGIAVFVLGVKEPEWPWRWRVTGDPIVPAIFALTPLAFVLSALFERPIESLFGFNILLLGIPGFLQWRRAAVPVPEFPRGNSEPESISRRLMNQTRGSS